VAEHPDVAYGSTNHYQSWEVVIGKMVPDGYVSCASIASAGRSPSFITCPREARTSTLHRMAGVQP
jgi:hypothetical protein